MVGTKGRWALLCAALLLMSACGAGVTDESAVVDPAHARFREDRSSERREHSRKVIRVPDTSTRSDHGGRRDRTKGWAGGGSVTKVTAPGSSTTSPGDDTSTSSSVATDQTAPTSGSANGGTTSTTTDATTSTTAAGSGSTQGTTSTTATTSPPPPAAPTPAAPAPTGSVLFREDFTGAASLTNLDFGIHHRDDFLVSDNQWPGDHAVTGPNDLCGPPTDSRTVTRGSRSSGFNNEWIYRCVPGGDLAKAHIMTSIGDTSGYSIGSFSPKQSFNGVREIRWDVNLTDLGLRQWTEVAVIPAGSYDTQNLPCLDLFPCDTTSHGKLGSVGTSFFNHEMVIANRGSESNGARWSDGRDPALSSKAIRRTHIFRDNGDGTLSFSIQREDGSFQTVTSSGSFPSGPVRVVFTDHNYTPEKGNDPVGFSWHWDNIIIAN